MIAREIVVAFFQGSWLSLCIFLDEILDKAEGPDRPTIADTQAGSGVTT